MPRQSLSVEALFCPVRRQVVDIPDKVRQVGLAQLLTDRGQPPLVLTSATFVGEEESRRLFDAAYDDYRRRVRRL